MATRQCTLTFPQQKRFSRRLVKVDQEKENDSSVKTYKISRKEPARPVEAVLNENSCSPTKIPKKDLLSDTAPRNLFAKPEEVSESVEKTLCDNADKNVKEKEKSCIAGDVRKEENGLSQAIRVLHSSQPTKLQGRDDKLEQITSLLLSSLENKKSASLYISGPPGTGKTACVNYILSQSNISSGFKTVYVNCTGLKSASAAFKRIADELKLKKESSEKNIQFSVEKHISTSKKMIMLVLDEMDQLESKKQSLLYTIFEWPVLYRSNLVLIGIANALDLTDRILPRLKAKLDEPPILFNFPPYSREEIIEILTNRLKEGGVDAVLKGGALQLLAGKVAAVSGDIRKALDIGRRVIEIAQNKSGNEREVALLDVLSVVNNVYGTSIALDNTEKEESFPLHQKILICTMILIKKNSKIKEMTIGRLHDVYRKVCAKRNLSGLDMSEFVSLTELVESRGVIRFIGKLRNRLAKIVLLWDEDEITNILQDKQLLSLILDDVSCLK